MIKIELSDINEANLILTGLGKLPAEMTYDLITKIRDQARAQLPPEQTQPGRQRVMPA